MVGPFFDIVREHDDGLHAFAAYLAGDVGHGEGAVHRLAARHRDRVVVENLVGDVDLRGHRLANRQRAGMEVGAVAQILEDVFLVGERCLPAPGHAFAAHLGKGVGVAVHPGDHVVAADAGHGPRAFRHHGGAVVRATRAVMRGARESGAGQGEFLFLRRQKRKAIADVLGGKEARQALGNHAGDARRGQFIGRGQDPLATLVVLANHAGAGRTIPVVHLLLHLRLEEAALLLDHDDVFQAAGKILDAARLQRPGHADLVHADADVFGGLVVDAQILERLQHVQVALASGYDTQARTRRIENDLVQVIGAGERQRRSHGVLMQAHFLIQRRVRPTDIQTARRQLEIGRNDNIQLVRIDVDAGRRLDRFSDGLEADPAPGKATHRPAEQAHVQNVLHASRIEYRHHRGHEFQFAAVR